MRTQQEGGTLQVRYLSYCTLILIFQSLEWWKSKFLWYIPLRLWYLFFSCQSMQSNTNSIANTSVFHCEGCRSSWHDLKAHLPICLGFLCFAHDSQSYWTLDQCTLAHTSTDFCLHICCFISPEISSPFPFTNSTYLFSLDFTSSIKKAELTTQDLKNWMWVIAPPGY